MQANGHLPAELESVPPGGDDQEAATISLISMAEQGAPDSRDELPARLQHNASPSQAGLQLMPVETPASPASSSGSALDPGLYRSLSMVSGTAALALGARDSCSTLQGVTLHRALPARRQTGACVCRCLAAPCGCGGSGLSWTAGTVPTPVGWSCTLSVCSLAAVRALKPVQQWSHARIVWQQG